MSIPAGRLYLSAATVSVAFAIWGSLFPFDYRPASLGEAIDLFWISGGPGRAQLSLSDAFSNFLLFVPIGLFGAACLGRGTRWPSGLLVVAGGVLLSIGVEIGQAFVPWRTPSTLDVVAEAAGTTAGVIGWRLVAVELDAMVLSALASWRHSSLVARLLIVYCGVFAVAWLIPFDFTLRPHEIGDKYFHKRLLLPLAPSPDAATTTQLRLTMAAAVPLGWAGAVCGTPPGAPRSAIRATLITMLALGTLALVQVPVFSRTTDFTLLLAAFPGVVAGTVGARLAHRRP